MFFIWTISNRGPEPQKWSERPSALVGNYWSGRIIGSPVKLSAMEDGMTLDALARKYPAMVEAEKY